MQNGMAIPKKLKYRITMWSSNPTSGYILKEKWKWNWNRYLHTNVHSSTNDNSQKVGATQGSVNRWMDKPNVVYMYDGIIIQP